MSNIIEFLWLGTKTSDCWDYVSKAFIESGHQPLPAQPTTQGEIKRVLVGYPIVDLPQNYDIVVMHSIRQIVHIGFYWDQGVCHFESNQARYNKLDECLFNRQFKVKEFRRYVKESS